MNARTEARGFTLLELLVAVSIGVALAGMLFVVAGSALSAWQRGQNRQDGVMQAKLALDLIERDLQAAMMRFDGNIWLACDVINHASTAAAHGWQQAASMKPSGGESQRMVPVGPEDSIENARFGLTGCWLRFFTGKLDRNTPTNGRDLSAPVAVSYQILRRRMDAAGAEVRYRFYRSEVRQTRTAAGASGTFQAGHDINSGDYSVASGTQADPGTVVTPVAADALADNIVDFGCWFYRRTAAGELQRIFPVDNATLAYRAPQGGVAPEVADVMIRVLSPAGAAQLAAMESGRILRPATFASDAAWWWARVEANSTVYVRRIELKGSAR